jgi:hypothetical protein
MDATSSPKERMSGAGLRWKLPATVAASLALLLTSAPAVTAADRTDVFPAGLACSFALQVEVTGGTQVHHEFAGPNGTLRILDAGKGSDLVFTNLANGHTYALSGNGTATWTRVDAGGSARLTLTGHNVLIYFPTDVPAGPSTTLVVGREVIAVDLATSQFTRLSRTGRTTDICAALS